MFHDGDSILSGIISYHIIFYSHTLVVGTSTLRIVEDNTLQIVSFCANLIINEHTLWIVNVIIYTLWIVNDHTLWILNVHSKSREFGGISVSVMRNFQLFKTLGFPWLIPCCLLNPSPSCREEVFLFNSFLTQNMEIVKTQFWIEERKEYMKDGFCPQIFTICPQYIVYTPITLYWGILSL